MSSLSFMRDMYLLTRNNSLNGTSFNATASLIGCYVFMSNPVSRNTSFHIWRTKYSSPGEAEESEEKERKK
jgi:hypothetical protein